MSIFNKKKPAQQPTPLFSDDQVDGTPYEQTLDFLVSVNDEDFSKIINIAKIYRNAHNDVADITGVSAEQIPSIFKPQAISQPAAPQTPEKPATDDTDAGNFLDEDDLDKAFAEGPEEKSVMTNIEVKDDTQS